MNTVSIGGKKNKIRKHRGINQTTGRLKPGYKYGKKKLKNGYKQIIKIKKKIVKRKSVKKPKKTVKKIKRKKSVRKSKKSVRKSKKSVRKSKKSVKTSSNPDKPCLPSSRKKYQSRPGPPIPANDCEPGTLKIGNDGKIYGLKKIYGKNKSYLRWIK